MLLQYSIWRLVKGPSWARQDLGRTLSLLTRRVLRGLFVLHHFACSSPTEQALRFFCGSLLIILIVYNVINQVHLGKWCKIEEKVRCWLLVILWKYLLWFIFLWPQSSTFYLLSAATLIQITQIYHGNISNSLKF